jgi:hypothetical protein
MLPTADALVRLPRGLALSAQWTVPPTRFKIMIDEQQLSARQARLALHGQFINGSSDFR